MTHQIEFIDRLIVLIYFIALFLVGFIRRGRRNDNDFMLSGRRLTLPVFVMTLVSTWYGGILGTGEFTYLYGISNWLTQGLPYYIFACIYAFFIAGRIRKSHTLTIPEMMESHYGKAPSVLSGVFVFILTSPAPYILAAGIILSIVSGLSTLTCAIIVFIFSAIYLYRKGFESVIQSDIIQFFLMFTSFIILLLMLLIKYPLMEHISIATLPDNHLSITGGLPALYIISWFFIAMWTLVDPGFHQRCASAATPGIARKGILISILFWAVFDGLTILTGLYAKALLPETEALFAYPALGALVLPAGLYGLFMTGLLATAMSTLDSFLFISAQTVGYDVLNKYRGFGVKRSIRFGYLLTGFISFILILLFPSIVDLWYFIGTLVIPALLIPVLSALMDRPVRKNIVLTMLIAPFTISLIFFILKYGLSRNMAGIEPFYPGLLCSAIIYIISLVSMSKVNR